MKKLAALLVAFLALPEMAAACRTCYGDPNSPMVKGAEAGVAMMIAIIACVLGTIGYYAWLFKKRAEALDEA